ncbi:MAG: SPOR domain-containing protein [Nitrospirota bacterium]
MREIRNFRKTKFNKNKTNRTIYFIAILAFSFVIAVVFIVLKTRGGTLSHDLTPGNIYTGDKQQDDHMPADEEMGTTSAESEQNDPSIQDDFTFYKVLNSKEGDITPLDVEPEKSTIEKEKDVEVLHEEKMSKIDGEIVRKIVDKSKDDIVYTVQLGALKQESAANELAGKLRSRGFAPYITKENSAGRAPVFKIRIGKFLSMVDAQEVAEVLKREGYGTYVLRISGSE